MTTAKRKYNNAIIFVVHRTGHTSVSQPKLGSMDVTRTKSSLVWTFGRNFALKAYFWSFRIPQYPWAFSQGGSRYAPENSAYLCCDFESHILIGTVANRSCPANGAADSKLNSSFANVLMVDTPKMKIVRRMKLRRFPVCCSMLMFLNFPVDISV